MSLLKNSESLITRLEEFECERTALFSVKTMAFPRVELIFTFTSRTGNPPSIAMAFLLARNVVLPVVQVPLVKMLPLDRNDDAKPGFS